MNQAHNKKIDEIIADYIFAMFSRRVSMKFVALLTIVSLNAAGLLAIGETIAYFNDTESSNENVFEAASLDFYLTNTEENEFLGVEVFGDLKFATVALQEAESLDIQYAVRAEKASGDDDFCAAVDLIAKHNGMPTYTGPVLDFSAPTTTAFGTWEFELDALPIPANFAHGDTCNVDFVFDGWREDVAEPALSGFTDEERFAVNMTSRMVVLNEYVPDPIGNECSVGGEWVELFNNGNEAIDLAGWEIKDAAGDVTTIATTTTMSGSTIIGANGSGDEWLVVTLDGCVLNNTGDTINLYDNSATLIDTQTYTTSLENKSDARIPDGIGMWIDPVPTPGKPNKLVEEVVEVQVAQGVAEEEADTEAPVLTLNGNNPALVQVGATYGDLGATVTDNVNNNLGVYLVENTVDTSVAGEYHVIYRSTDQAGNDGFVERTVIVYDPADGIPEIEEVEEVEESVLEEEVVEAATEEEPKEETLVEEYSTSGSGGGSEPEPTVEEGEPAAEEEPTTEEPAEEEATETGAEDTGDTEEAVEESVSEEEATDEESVEQEEVVSEEEVLEETVEEEPIIDEYAKQEENIEEIVEEITEELVMEDPVEETVQEDTEEMKEPEPEVVAEEIVEEVDEPVVEEVVEEEPVVEEDVVEEEEPVVEVEEVVEEETPGGEA